ncbi:MAG: hypothetical protein JW888_04955 [Pirellulales bacterium]|nr:hypothetical protein [Pirellulales bacterium]
MSKRWIVLLSALLVSFALGCEQPKVIKPEGEIAPPPPESETFNPGASGIDMSGANNEAPKTP